MGSITTDQPTRREATTWPGPYCEACIEGYCDLAEHRGWTDADVPLARCPNCLDLSCHGCMDPAETRLR